MPDGVGQGAVDEDREERDEDHVAREPDALRQRTADQRRRDDLSPHKHDKMRSGSRKGMESWSLKYAILPMDYAPGRDTESTVQHIALCVIRETYCGIHHPRTANMSWKML
jgi:hypothetical protein